MKTIIYTLLLVLGSTTFHQSDVQTDLQGKVTDQGTGEPIIFASVAIYKNGVLVTGSETDFDGNYSFSNIAPGTYDMEVSYVGYSTKKISGIKVLAGRVNKLDVALDGKNVVLDEVLVIDYRVPLVEQDNTTSGATITSDQIKNLPKRNINGTGKRKASKNRSATVRGSRSNATDYYVDGVRVQGNLVPGKSKKKNQPDIRQNTKEQVAGGEEYSQLPENEFIKPQKEAFSTFSIDVDRASYSNVRRFINNNQLPPPDAVRTEEMINYFTYDYPQPEEEKPFAIHTEVGECPWNRANILLQIGLQGENMNLQEAPANNLVFLIDVSGSMGSQNKLPLVKKAFRELIQSLRAEDKISIVVYAGAAGLVLPPTSGGDKQAILQALESLTSGGSTAGGAGIQLAYQTAKEQLLKEGNNRVILATDGDFNVGTSSPDQLEKLIKSKRKDGIYLTCLGFGMGNYKDNRMEILADKGNGNYAYIDNFQEARKVFGTEITGTLYTIAKDVKIQVAFNKESVQSYRLIGYENRLLAKEDFDDDTKDAGELGAGHTVTALYEIVPRQERLLAATDPVMTSEGPELAQVRLRFKKPKEKQSELIIAQPIARKISLEETSDNFRFASAVAGFSLMLRKSKYLDGLTYERVLALAESAQGKDPFGYRQEFIGMIKQAKSINDRTANEE